MNKSTHEEQLSQQLHANIEQFKMAATFRTGLNGIFNDTTSNNKFFLKSFTNEDGFTQITIPPGGYEIESINKEFKGIIVDEGLFTQANYPFRMKPKFSILGYNIKFSPQGPIKSFMFDDSIRDFGDYIFPEQFVVVKSLTGPIIGLHFMRHNSVVIDTTHGFIPFPHLTLQVKSTSSGTSAKPQVLLVQDSITVPPMAAKPVKSFVDLL